MVCNGRVGLYCYFLFIVSATFVGSFSNQVSRSLHRRLSSAANVAWMRWPKTQLSGVLPLVSELRGFVPSSVKDHQWRADMNAAICIATASPARAGHAAPLKRNGWVPIRLSWIWGFTLKQFDNKVDLIPGGVVGALLERGSVVPQVYCGFNLEMKMEDRTKVISACLMREKFPVPPSLSLSHSLSPSL